MAAQASVHPRLPPTLLLGTAIPSVWTRPVSSSRFGDVALVLFLLAQCFDGALTYVGVATFGVAIEANPILQRLMMSFGEGAALTTAKIVAAILGICLHLQEVHGVVALLSAFYFAAAVVPWLAILFF